MPLESQHPIARVLNVGHCGLDHPQIQRAIEDHFAAQVHAAATADEASTMLSEQRYDLVLVNRIFDRDGESGIQWIQKLKADQRWQSLPVMLVSNYAEAQAQAVKAGAWLGFGKYALGHPDMLRCLAPFLPPRT